MRYTESELKILEDNFADSGKEKIIALMPNRTWNSLKSKAYSIGLSRPKFNPSNILKNNFKKLLDDNPETLYWIGYFLADGSIAKCNNQCSISSSDKSHIIKFQEFLNIENLIAYKSKISTFNGKSYKSKQSYKVTFADRRYIHEFIEKYDLKYSKTYKPPSPLLYGKLPNNLLLSLIIGFIDGDGTSYKLWNKRKTKFKKVIQMHVHSSWVDFLTDISTNLDEICETSSCKPRIGNDGYCIWRICKQNIIYKLACEINANQLPVSRKWTEILEHIEDYNEIRPPSL